MSEEAYEEYKKRKNKDFYNKYPYLFPKGEPYCGFACDYGWWPLIDILCSQITELIQDKIKDNKKTKKPKPQVIIAQIKEKFGGLRFYVDTENVDEHLYNEIYKLINKAEEKSFEICEACGNLGERSYKGTGTWIKTLCEKCKKY